MVVVNNGGWIGKVGIDPITYRTRGTRADVDLEAQHIHILRQRLIGGTYMARL